MMGENPFLSDPNINKVRKALAHARVPRRAGHLPDRDGRVRRRDPARDLLHGEGRHLHEHRPPRADRPQGARPARRGARGLADHHGDLQPRRPADGLRVAERDLRRARVGDAQLRRAALRQPRADGQALSQPGPASTATARSCCSTSASAPTTARPTSCRPSGCRPRSCPSDEYPFVLNTGRLLEHWHTGSMTRRSYALDAIQPEAHVYLNPDDAAEMGVADGDFVRVSSRRGTIELRARLSHRDTPRHVLHPVPLPRGGGQPADHRRDRPDGQDPRVQVLRGQDRAGRQQRQPRARDRARGRLMATDVTTGGGDGNGARPTGMPVQPRFPGTEARAGKFPGPEPDPGAVRDPGASRLAAARGARRAVARRAPPALRDRGPDLVLPALPHRRRRPRSSSPCATTCRAGCTTPTSGSRELKERYGDDVEIEVREVSCLGRCDVAPAAAVDERPIRAGRRRRPRRGRARAAVTRRSRPSAATSRAPTTPTRRARSATACCAAAAAASSTARRSSPR